MSGEADEYESETHDSQMTEAGTRHYQISVPNYYLVGKGGEKSSSSTGNSFLRLGSFPTSLTEGTNPAGFGASYALAKIIGDPPSIVAQETADVAPTDPTTPSYNGDSNYLLGFADDTRYRTDSAWSARQDETLRLLKKGGWWDHADGNRISTTAGDRIDVIQGNYKMLVLGRPQQRSGAPAVSADLTRDQLAKLAAGALVTDVSGGLMVENGPSPTHCIKSIEYVKEEDTDTWEVYQNNGIGNVYSSFYGDTVDIFLGQYKSTWTGKVPDDYHSDDEDDDVTAVYHVYQKSLAIRKKLGEITDDPDPIIMDHMWAQKIRDYKRVSGDVRSDVQANNFWSRTYAKPGKDGGGGQIQADTIATTITNTATAATITNVNTAANHFNITTGLQENVAIGLQGNLFVGGQANLFYGGKIDVTVGPTVGYATSSLLFRGMHEVVTVEKSELEGVDNKITALKNAIAETANEIASAKFSAGTSFLWLATEMNNLSLEQNNGI